jgi:hypothetical protein
MNYKFTKRDILSAVGLFAIIFGLIAATVLFGKVLGIPEFLSWF